VKVTRILFHCKKLFSAAFWILLKRIQRSWSFLHMIIEFLVSLLNITKHVLLLSKTILLLLYSVWLWVWNLRNLSMFLFLLRSSFARTTSHFNSTKKPGIHCHR
jgi:hypothetical protein